MIAVGEGEWRVELDPAGGAIRRAVFRDRDIMRPYRSNWDAFPVLCNACFPLAPYSNRIRDGRFSFGQRHVELPSVRPGDRHALHGVGWIAPWEVDTFSAGGARLRYRHDSAGWPWRFEAEQWIKIEDGRLTLALHLTNTDAQAQPAGLGFHPYFPRDEETQLKFAAEGVWTGAQAGLSEELESVPENWDFSTGLRLGGEEIDHCFSGWDGQASIEWPERGLCLSISASDALRHAVLFTPPGQSYFCFEPVSHMSDAVNRLDFDTTTGLRVLQPGQTLETSISLTPSLI